MEFAFSMLAIRFAVKKNLVLDSISDAVSELRLFHQAGGGTMCDVTITGIRNKPEALPQISRESGVNIITGTGYYIDAFLPEDVKLLSTHEVGLSLHYTLTYANYKHCLANQIIA